MESFKGAILDASRSLAWRLATTGLRRSAIVGALTKSRIQHVQSHAVALLGTSDSDQALIAAVLGFVDLDNASADLSDLVDFLAAFANNRAYHIVRNVDLLGQRRARHARTAWHGLRLRAAVSRVRTGMRAVVRLLHVSCGAVRPTRLLRSTVVHGDRRVWLCSVGLRAVGRSVRLWGHLLTTRIVAGVVPAIVLASAVIAACRLGHVWNHLHSPGNRASRSATPGSVGRRRRSAEPFVELLQEGTSHVVCRYVNGVGHPHDDQ